MNWYPSAQALGYFVGIIHGCIGTKCPDINPESEVGQLDNSHATIFTPFDESISEHIDKNRGLHGVPYRTSVDATPPANSYEACVINYPDNLSKCEGKLGDFLPANDHHIIRGCAGKDCPSIDSSDPYDDATDNPGAGITSGGATDGPNSIRSDLLWLSCWRIGARSKTGIGVAGGRGLDGTKPYLGTLGIVCQPYSLVEWSMNWDFLSAEFRPAPDKLEHNLNANLNASQFRWLNQILIDWYQILDGQTYLSPLPMQLCAPGYIMRGLEVSAGEEFIRGITAVYCVQPEFDIKDAPCLADDSAYPCKIDTDVAGTSRQISLSCAPY